MKHGKDVSLTVLYCVRKRICLIIGKNPKDTVNEMIMNVEEVEKMI